MSPCLGDVGNRGDPSDLSSLASLSWPAVVYDTGPAYFPALARYAACRAFDSRQARKATTADTRCKSSMADSYISSLMAVALADATSISNFASKKEIPLVRTASANYFCRPRRLFRHRRPRDHGAFCDSRGASLPGREGRDLGERGQFPESTPAWVGLFRTVT